MKLGIVGLPNVGKSTLFNAITNAGAESANYPFCTIEPNMGVVTVPDARLDWLSELYHPKKTTPAVIEFVDIAGLVKGASKGAGLGNQFLGNIRATDAIVHVVRCFDDDNIMHVVENANEPVPVDPAGDIATIDLELIMADLEMVERRIKKAENLAKGDKKYLHEVELFKSLASWLNDGNSVRSFECDDPDDAKLLDHAELLSRKAIIYAANMDENGFVNHKDNTYYKTVAEIAAKEAPRCSLCAPSWRRRSPSSPLRTKPCSWRTWARASRVWIGSSRPATSCWASSPSSPAGRTSAGPGPSPGALRRPRRRGRSTPTSSGVSLELRWLPLRICRPWAPWPPPGKRAWCAARAKNTSWLTATWCCSALTFKVQEI